MQVLVRRCDDQSVFTLEADNTCQMSKYVFWKGKGVDIIMTNFSKDTQVVINPSYQARYKAWGSPAGPALKLIPGLIHRLITILIPHPLLVSYT